MFGAKNSVAETGGKSVSAAPKSGMEAMLKNLGLGEVMEAARQLASSGSIEKILAFSEGLDTLNERLREIERKQDLILGLHGVAAFAGPDTGGDGGSGGIDGREPAPVKSGANRRVRGTGVASGDAHDNDLQSTGGNSGVEE